MSQKWWLGLDKNDEESLVRKDIVCESHESISNESFRKNSVSSIIPEQIYLNEKISKANFNFINSFTNLTGKTVVVFLEKNMIYIRK